MNNRFCCTPATLVLADDRKACEYGFRGARFFQESLATYFFSRERIEEPIELSRGPLTSCDLEKAMASRSGQDSQLANIIGDPVAAIESVKRFVAAGVDELILVMALGTVPHAIVDGVDEDVCREGHTMLRLTVCEDSVRVLLSQLLYETEHSPGRRS